MAAPSGHFKTLILVAASWCGCGHSEPLPVRVAPPPAPPAAPRVVADTQAPLSLPHDLVLAGRWRNPTALLGKLSEWGGGDLSLEHWLRARLAQPVHPVDLDSPIELLVVLDRRSEPPALTWALSLGVDAARGGAAQARSVHASPRDVSSPIGLACAEATALGPDPLRMVCAPSDNALALLLPHATRALPLASLGDADVDSAFSLRAQPLADVDDQEIHNLLSAWLSEAWGLPSVNKRFDAQWAGLVSSLTRELRDLAADLDGSSIEFSLEAGKEALELAILAPAAAGRSTLGKLIRGNGASGLAPSEFWHAHEASEDAGFIWAFESTPLAEIRRPLAALLGTVLDFRGVPDRLQQQARELLETLPLPRGPVVHASGRLPAPRGGRPARPAWLDELGWQMYSVRGSFDEYRFYVSALVQAFNDPVLGAQLGRLLRGAFGPRWVPQRMRQHRLSHGGHLPKDSFGLDVTFVVPRVQLTERDLASAGSEREAPPTLHVVFVPDEDGVKIAWGADANFLMSLVSAPRSATLATTLANRAGLGSLHQDRTLAGGFYSLAALEEGSRSSVWGRALWDAEAMPVANAPHRGLSPIVYSLSQPSEAAKLQLTVRLTRGTIEDLFFLSAAQARAN